MYGTLLGVWSDFLVSSGGGVANDFVSNLVNSVIVNTNADATMAYATVNVFKATTAGHTATLPAPSAGRMVEIEVTTDSTKLITLAPNGAEKIDGVAANRILWAGERVLLRTDGTDWFKVAGLTIPMLCNMFLTNPQTVATGTLTTVLLDTIRDDNTGLMGDTGNNRINIKRGGNYLIVGAANYTNIATAATRVISDITVTGTQVANGECAGVAGGYTTPFVASPKTSLTTSDNVTLVTYQNSIGNETLQGSGVVAASFIAVVEIPSW